MPAERAILVGAPRKGARGRQQVQEHLLELARLADTAGAEVVGELTQLLDRPNPATYLGRGKLEELQQHAAAHGATLILFDDDLTPAQARNVEQATGIRVMDRTELILDIFATRARTSEAKMQVELAQLAYLLPRLTRMWTHLEKFRGGIGMRGPGETQLETDRRLIDHRIRMLRERLAAVQRTREVQRNARRGAFRVSLVGYTNAGKSSVLRALSGAAEVMVEDRLFATLDPLTREVPLGERGTVLVTDTVGFIRKLPHDLVASFRATLEEVRESDLLLHVVDVSHAAWEEQVAVVRTVLAELGAGDAPALLVLNKSDRLSDAVLLDLQTRVLPSLQNAVLVSACEEGGLEPLRRSLLAAVRRLHPLAELRVPARDGRLLAEVHRVSHVLDQRSEGDEMVLRARLGEAELGRLRSRGAVVRPA